MYFRVVLSQRIDPTFVRLSTISRSFHWMMTLSTLTYAFNGRNVHDELHDWWSHDFSLCFFFPPPPPAFLAYRRAYRPPWSYLFLSGREICWITRGYPPLLGRYCILVVGCQMKPTKPVVLRIYRVFAAMFWLVFYVWRECCAVRGSASRRRPGSRGAPFSPPLFRQNDRERGRCFFFFFVVSFSSQSLFRQLIPSLF